MESKISIIVPVYNVEKYLCQCLDSIINQTYKNLEIILVNDGSKDNSPIICDEYAKKDKRIKVVHQNNKGVSSARNKGIELSTGDYIMFVDSDDWIDKDTCLTTSKMALEYSADVVLWTYVREYENESKEKNIFNDNIIIFNKQDVKKQLHRRMIGIIEKELNSPQNSDALVPIWCKLYKSYLIKNREIKFVDLKDIGTSEDALFNLLVFEDVEKALYINKHLYHYRKENLSSVTTKYKPHLYDQWNTLFTIIEKYISSNKMGTDYYIALDNRVSLSIIGLGLNVLNSEECHFKKINQVKKIINSSRYKKACKSLQIKHLPIHWKFFFIFAILGNATCVYLMLLTIKKLK